MLLDQMLGPYRIAGKLGEGGMGEVYRATDTNLKRQVAIKVLPPSVADDPDRLARFQREAEVLASLNHPNIAAIYGLERSGSHAALVMELVEGPTLADRIAQGPVPIDEAIAIARQIADALDAAHEQGIIHRDLKPANIKVKPDGGAKVLDFGLAKAIAGAGGAGQAGLAGWDPQHSPTITSPAMMTGVGVILGTAAYMSPEQARGKAVDKRTDIWAFGCVLYEMLTGRCAFAADDVVATLAAVVKDHPDWNALPQETPASLRGLLQRLLEKDPRRRARDIGDARAALDALDAPDVEHTPKGHDRGVWRWTIAAGIIGVVTGVALTWMAVSRMARPVPPLVAHVSLRLAAGQRITTAVNDPIKIAISPDGTRIAYSAGGRIYLRPIDAADATAIPNTEDGTGPFFSQDGQSIGFAQNTHLMKIALAGGVPRRLADVFFLAGARWGADGAIVFADATRGIFRVDSAGGTPTQLVAAEPGRLLVLPEVLPGGDWVLFTQTTSTSTQFETIAYSIKTRERKLVVENGSAIYLSTGHLLYGFPGAGFFVAPFDRSQARVTGPEVALRLGLADAPVDVSRNGTLVFTKGVPDSRRTLVWVTRDGKRSPLPLEPGPYRFPRLSPDGTRLAFGRTDLTMNKSDIWVHTLSGSTATRLTFDEKSGFPVWASDGRRLALSGSSTPNLRLFLRQADGTGRATLLGDSRSDRYPYLWFDRDTKLMFTELHEKSLDIGTIDVSTGKERMLLASPANETRPDVSPDGQWLAYTSNESGHDEVYVRPMADLESGKWQVSTAGGHSPLWIAGGRELAYRAPGHVMSAAIRPGSPFRFDPPQALFADTYVNDTGGRSYDVSRDGRFLMLDDEANATDQIELVFNWFEELKRILQKQ